MGLNSQSVSTIPGKSEILNVNGLISEYNEINNWTKDEDDAKMVKYWVQTVTFKNQYIIDPQGITMSNAIKTNENIKIDSPRISKNNNNTLISIETNKEDENCQHTLMKNNRSLENEDQDIEDDKYSTTSLIWKDLYPQVLASCVSLLMQIQPGVNLAYSNNLFYYMPSLNKEELSWITSILALCVPVGAFFIGLIMDQIGRKKSCLLTCLPLLASWVLPEITSSDNVYVFVASRMLAGIGAGMTTVSLVYVSEISHPSYKQLLLSLMSVYFSGGILISTLITRLDWDIVNLSFIGFSIINMVLIVICLPESPIWLLQFKRSEYGIGKAKSAMKQIYPNNEQLLMAEWNRVVAMSASDANLAADAVNKPRSFIQSLRTNPATYKPMAVMFVMMLLVQLSGAYPTISYALSIFKSLRTSDGQSANEIMSLTMLGTMRFISGLLTCMLSFYVGRKPLLIISCFGMVTSSALVIVVAAGFVNNISWALCGIMMFVFSSSLGVIVFPWTMIYELLPTSVKAIGSSLLVSYSYLIMFVVMKIFPYVLAITSVSKVFMMFGTVSLLMAIYVYFVLPETLGKSFKDIENYFTQSKKK